MDYEPWLKNRPDLLLEALRIEDEKEERAARQVVTDAELSVIQNDREVCKSFIEFVRSGWHVLEKSPYVHGFHMEGICEHLEAVSYGKIQHLLANVSPGSSKSLLFSVFWPAWEWGPLGRPEYTYLTGSYEQTLAHRDNRRMRRLVESEWYQARWPLELTKTGDELFENAKGGERRARAFKSMTGGRANRVIIDDPHSVATAESPVERASTVQTFRESITDRLRNMDTDSILIIMQRLHVADIAGTILDMKLPYEFLMIPMEFEPERSFTTSIGWRDPRTHEGELMCPERWSRKVVDDLKKTKGSYAWAGQYQQSPTLREGGMFKREFFRIVEAAPAATRWVRFWDIAATEEQLGQDPAWTAGLKLGRQPDGRFIVGDVNRLRAEGNGVRRMIKSTAIADGPHVEIGLPQDPGAAGKIVAQDMVLMLAGFIVSAAPESGDKVQRASPVAAQAEAGNIDLLKGDWNEAFLSEACLAAGTMITTDKGPVPIERIKCSDRVMTRKGWRRVTASGLTNTKAELHQITFSNGSHISATQNHPILVPGYGFKKVSQLRANDGLLRFIEASPSTSVSEVPTQQNGIFQELSTSAKLIFTATFGNARWVQCLQAITFTTSTMIPKTIASKILSAFQPLNTHSAIACGRSQNSHQPASASFAGRTIFQSNLSDHSLVQKNAKIETNSLKEIRSRKKSIRISAELAASSSYRQTLHRFIATFNAPLLSFTFLAALLLNLVSTARNCLSRKRQPDGFAADLAVSAIRTLPGRHCVYNLEVEGEHEYVANGIVVHNCDFPGGKFKDQVDALSGAFAKLIGATVFDVSEEFIAMEAVKVQGIWPRVGAIFIGRTKFTAIWLAQDTVSDTIYLYDSLVVPRQDLAIHANAIKKKGPWIPMLFDPKGDGRDEAEGIRLAQTLDGMGITIFTVKYDEEAAMEVLGSRLTISSFWVFEQLLPWFAAYRRLTRNDKGEIVGDDTGVFHATGLALHSGLEVAITENRAESDQQGFDRASLDRDPVTGY